MHNFIDLKPLAERTRSKDEVESSDSILGLSCIFNEVLFSNSRAFLSYQTPQGQVAETIIKYGTYVAPNGMLHLAGEGGPNKGESVIPLTRLCAIRIDN